MAIDLLAAGYGPLLEAARSTGQGEGASSPPVDHPVQGWMDPREALVREQLAGTGMFTPQNGLSLDNLADEQVQAANFARLARMKADAGYGPDVQNVVGTPGSVVDDTAARLHYLTSPHDFSPSAAEWFAQSRPLFYNQYGAR